MFELSPHRFTPLSQATLPGRASRAQEAQDDAALAAILGSPGGRKTGKAGAKKSGALLRRGGGWRRLGVWLFHVWVFVSFGVVLRCFDLDICWFLIFELFCFALFT